MSALSMDLRERIVAACSEGTTKASVARRFGVCSKTVGRLVKRAARGELAPRPLPGRAPRLRAEDEEAFVLMVDEKSDWTIEALRQEWHKRSGVLLPKSTLHDHLQRLRGRFKKRAAFRQEIAALPVEKLVFLDECGFALNLHRLYGWTIGGGRCIWGWALHRVRAL